jgi:hypothetical protein
MLSDVTCTDSIFHTFHQSLGDLRAADNKRHHPKPQCHVGQGDSRCTQTRSPNVYGSASEASS